MTTLKIEVREESGDPVVHLSGRLIGTELGRLQHSCLEALHRTNGDLVIDLSHVDYIDSLSIGRLVALNSTASKSNKRVVITHLQPKVMESLKMLHIDKVITIR